MYFISLFLMVVPSLAIIEKMAKWSPSCQNSPMFNNRIPHYERRNLKMKMLNTAPPKIIIAGAPASGKGTQCESITREFGVVHLSTGDILRAAVREKTPLGVQAQSFMDAGQLVPDDLIIGVVKDRLNQEDCKVKGWLLDGFPRTRSQADALSEANLTPDCFILLDVPQEVLVDRVEGRRTDPQTGKIYHMKYSPPESEEIASRLVQRSDDTAEKIVVRYKEFQSHINAVKEGYQDKLITVDGTMSSKDVSYCVISGISACLENRQTTSTKSTDVKSASSPTPLKIIIAGAPASGKGTQCESITREFGVVHLSTGDILRAAVREKTPLGVQAQSFMDAGQLVPDDLIIGVVKDRLNQEDCKVKGWLLDGFPRTRSQADALSEANLTPDCFILLDVPQEVLVDRVEGRRTDPQTGKIYHMKYSPPESEEIASRLVQRSDDTAEKIVVRYKEFQSHINAVKEGYQDKLITVDGTMSSKDVSYCITTALKSIQLKKEEESKQPPDSDNDGNGSSSGALEDDGFKLPLISKLRSDSKLSNTLLGMSFLILMDRMLLKVFKNLGWTFPSSLAGMIGVFAVLQCTHSVSPEAADKISNVLSPAVSLLKAWLPLFFVPPLVVLPLKASVLSGSAIPVGAIMSAGLMASLTFSSAFAESLSTPGTSSENTITKASTPTSTPPSYPSLDFPALLTASSLLLSGRAGLDQAAVQRVFGLSATMLGFLAGVKAPATVKKLFGHPVLACTAVTIILLNLFSFVSGTPLKLLLSSYFGSGLSGAGDIVSSLLGPAVISFGLQLYQYREMLIRNAVRMGVVTAASAMFGLSSSAAMAGKLFRLTPPSSALATLTRCITTPLALAGCGLIGGDASIAAFIVVLTGILGASFGESFLSYIGIQDPVSVGISIGASAHGLGAAAVSYDAEKFAAALVSMTLTGFWTICFLSTPFIRNRLVGMATGL